MQLCSDQVEIITCSILLSFKLILRNYIYPEYEGKLLIQNKMSLVKIPCFIVRSLENAHVKELLFICDKFQ